MKYFEKQSMNSAQRRKARRAKLKDMSPSEKVVEKSLIKNRVQHIANTGKGLVDLAPDDGSSFKIMGKETSPSFLSRVSTQLKEKLGKGREIFSNRDMHGSLKFPDAVEKPAVDVPAKSTPIISEKAPLIGNATEINDTPKPIFSKPVNKDTSITIKPNITTPPKSEATISMNRNNSSLFTPKANDSTPNSRVGAELKSTISIESNPGSKIPVNNSGTKINNPGALVPVNNSVATRPSLNNTTSKLKPRWAGSAVAGGVGALVGGAIGGAIGSNSDNTGTGVAVGSTVGGIAGVGAGRSKGVENLVGKIGKGLFKKI